MKLWKHRAVIGLVLGAFVTLASGSESPTASEAPQTTASRMHEPGWWPTKGDAARRDYAGAASCAKCHAKEFADQQQTSMARAAYRSNETAVLRENARLTATISPFVTDVTRARQGSTYTTARGGEAIRGQVIWSMGDGVMGQTFILDSNNVLYESQLSYFPSIHSLDLTPGHSRAAPRDLERAFGERQSPAAAAQCFGCHTTASVVKGQLDASRALPGVTCEVCHGPGGKHVAAMEQGKVDEALGSILNPASFSPSKLIDYCGACHRAPLDVASEKIYFPINVRFQPYRLSKSRCWSRPDKRLTCIACHDPHEQVARDPAYYDSRCLACHLSKSTTQTNAAATLKACPVSANRCTSCHMPKYEVPQMHGSFTDHDIRVVREGQAYPL